MARRRKRSSPWRVLPLWIICLALISWGLWQLELFRRSIVDSGQGVGIPVGMAVATLPAEPVETMLLAPAIATQEVTLELDSLPQPQEVTGPLVPTPAFEEALSADDLAARGATLLSGGQTLAARFTLNAALARSDESRAAQLRRTLASINMPVFLGTELLPGDPCARTVSVQPGDTFLSLAKAYGIPSAFLQRINPALDPRNLRPGNAVKIIQGPFHGRIFKQAGRLDLYARDIYVASCVVAFPEGNYLPRGEYLVAAGTKLQLGAPPAVRTWIGFQGLDAATEPITHGWLFGTAGIRGNDPRDRATGIRISDGDLQQLYNVLSESRSRLRVEP